jgi:superfamily II DNA helicase RecQ
MPPYALFTNEQLAEMVARRVTTLPALGEIPGIGKARLEKYGSLFVESLQKAFAAEPKPADEAPSDQPP